MTRPQTRVLRAELAARLWPRREATPAAWQRGNSIARSGVNEREHIAAFDVLRTLAATAVVVIHVLGPYRDRLNEIPHAHWTSAIALNGLSRWAVPVFIMITGALSLADSRAFSLRYYLDRRVAKVVIPFVAWSVLYALFAGVSITGYDSAVTTQRLADLPTHASYYHLGFFYYFIPLYLLIPVLKWLIDSNATRVVMGLTVTWLVLTVLYLFDADGLVGVDLVMYGGYLLLGYLLFVHRSSAAAVFVVLTPLALVAVALTDYVVIHDSLDAGRYVIGRWFSYKTINAVVVAAAVFAGVLAFGDRLSAGISRTCALIGKHSLGIFLIHPLFLWPVHELDLYHGHPLLIVPLWTAVCGGLALGMSCLLHRHRATAWLVP